MVACQNEEKSRSLNRKNNACGVFICAVDRKGRAIFLHQKASRASLFVRIYPTHSPFGIATVTPVFYASNIAHTVLHPPRSGKGTRPGEREWGSGFRAGTEIELETTLHSLRRIRSTPVNLCIEKSEFSGFMLLTRPIRLRFFIFSIITIITAGVTSTKSKIFINPFSRFYHRLSFLDEV